MMFEDCKMRWWGRRCGPEQRVVVGKEGEEDSEEEGSCYIVKNSPLGPDILS